MDGMERTAILNGDYSAYAPCYQPKIPFATEVLIPNDDPVRLLSTFVEGMDLSALYDTYARIRKNQATPRQMLKILIYANMNGLYSSRAIETACRRDINFMYLLEGNTAPDHATIARFVSLHLADCAQELMAEMSNILLRLGEISGKTLFIDGTKIESCANKYTFVWKKAVTKNMAKLADQILTFISDCETAYGITIVHHDKVSIHTLKRLRKALYRIKKGEGIEFVHGIGKRKSPLQRSIEKLEEYLARMKTYTQNLHICGDRNSYAKTDPDATFMRMKEDAMLNGQLKPGYNLQHGVDSDYIVWLDISSRPTDVTTLLPFIKGMEQHLPFKYREIVADAGYESEENYVGLEKNGQIPYIKPQNYEQSKTRKFQKDIGRRENMDYDGEKDEYTCHNGKKLTVQSESKKKTGTGYVRTTTIYECQDCHDCPFKKDCIKGNHCNTPLEQRKKRLTVSKVMEEKRKEDLERITSDYGKQLRMNRSIQAEGSFAEIKEDMNFRRYLYRGKKNVLAQSVMVAFARNINKLHHKIQSGTTGFHLYELKEAG